MDYMVPPSSFLDGMLLLSVLVVFVCSAANTVRWLILKAELKELEEQTGFILSNSPTQTVGYYPVSELAKVTHPTPLLSLEKTKLLSELLSQDPRDRFIHDNSRIWGLTYGNYNIRFQVHDNVLTVSEVTGL